MADAKLRAWWAHRQGHDGSLLGQSASEVLEGAGWARSVAGAGPYLTLFSRAGLSRAEIDAAVADVTIHELPAARGCTYILPSADYALADTGSLVFFSESGDSRLLSLLPPCHIAVIESSKIVASLDDIFRLRALPGWDSSAMVVITGPSRTADIEMRLVRGVHGPGEIHVIVVEDVTHSQ